MISAFDWRDAALVLVLGLLVGCIVFALVWWVQSRRHDREAARAAWHRSWVLAQNVERTNNGSVGMLVIEGWAMIELRKTRPLVGSREALTLIRAAAAEQDKTGSER